MTSEETFWLTVMAHVQLAFILIAVIIFWMIPRPGRLEFIELGLVLMISLTIEVAGSIAVHLFHSNMNFLGNIFILAYLPLIVLLYRNKVQWEKKNIVTWTIIVVYLIFHLINLATSSILTFNGYSSTFTSVCCIAITLGYFYSLIRQLPTESITKLPMFWVSTSLLIYHAGTFVFFLSADYLIRVMNNNLIGYWMFHHSFGLIQLIMMWYALILVRKEHLTKQADLSPVN